MMMMMMMMILYKCSLHNDTLYMFIKTECINLRSRSDKISSTLLRLIKARKYMFFFKHKI